MRLTFISIIILSLGCQNPKTNTGSENIDLSNTTGITKEIIPEKVKEYININFPGWVFPDTSDYIKAWWSFYSKDQVPYFAAADINDDNKVDFGLLLKNENALLMVILVDSADTYMHRICEKFSQKDTEKIKNIVFGITIEPPGRTDCIVNGQEQSLVLRSNGIILNNYEFKYRIYYWSGGDLRVFRVADKVVD